MFPLNSLFVYFLLDLLMIITSAPVQIKPIPTTTNNIVIKWSFLSAELMKSLPAVGW